MAKPFDVVCIGHATLDHLVRVKGPLPRDGRVYADDFIEAGGGPAATAAVTLARLGRRVAMVGAVGADTTGHRIREGLADTGVDVTHLELQPGVRSPTSVVLVDGRAGTRTILAYLGTGGPLRLPGAALEAARSATWVHVDRLGYEAVSSARGAIDPALLSIDAGHPRWSVDLDGVGLFAPSIAFLRDRYPGRTRDRALRAALAEGVRAVVVTDGARGSWARTADGAWHAEAHQVDAVSTLGAGDVFHGALLDGRLDGRDWPDALRRASVAASLSCRALDGRSAIPDAIELDDAMADGPDEAP